MVKPEDPGDSGMDTNETDDTKGKAESPTQHNQIETTNNVIQSIEDPRKKNEGDNSKIQPKKEESEEIFPDKNDRQLQQATSLNKEPEPTEIQEGNTQEI